MIASGLRAKKTLVFCSIGLALWYPCYWLLSMAPSDVTVTLVEHRLNRTSSAFVGELELDGLAPSPLVGPRLNQTSSALIGDLEFDSLTPSPLVEHRLNQTSSALIGDLEFHSLTSSPLVEHRLNQITSALVMYLEFNSHSSSPDNRSPSQPPSELNDSRPEATSLVVAAKEFSGRSYSPALTRQYNVTCHAMWDEGLWQEFVRYSSSSPAPYVNVLLATWRTGSTFIGKMLTAHPGSFYHYEPMHGLGLHQVRDGVLLEEASSRLLQLAHCNISAKYAESSRMLRYGLQNSAPWSWECGASKTSRRDATHWCWDPEFLRDLCQIHPYQLIKTVRVRLNALQLLLQDSPNARVVVLGRDPRATKHSRRSPLFCKRREPLCDDPGLCSDMVKDYHTAVTYDTLFPGRVRLMRYEDLVEAPMEKFQNLTNFYSLKFTETMQERILKSMNGTAMVLKEPKAAPKIPKYSRVPPMSVVVSAHTIVRDSKFEAQEWRLEMPWQDVVKIQDECEEAMRLWGYNNAPSEDQLKTFEPVGAFTNNIKL